MDKAVKGWLMGLVGLNSCGILLALVVVFVAIGVLFPSSAPRVEKDTALPGNSADISKAEWERIFRKTEDILQIPWEFVAAIAYQETGMGHNMGNCSYFPPAPSGGHVLSSGNGLRSTNDQTNFRTVAQKTGNPENKEVSCNANGQNGGAMGYLQVMPTEWVSNSTELEPKIGHYPNPWNGQDASHMAGRILKGKIGVGIDAPFPETEEMIKKAAGRYFGREGTSYSTNVYNKYLEIKQRGSL